MRFTTIAAIFVCAVNANVVIGAEKANAKSANRPVTITGCLERDHQEFRLTETSGAQAPRARSWKTGFLKKQTSNLDVVDPSKKIKLKDHVGHRDALTGVVQEGELRVQSVRHLAASCGQ